MIKNCTQIINEALQLSTPGLSGPMRETDEVRMDYRSLIALSHHIQREAFSRAAEHAHKYAGYRSGLSVELETLEPE